MKYSINKKVFKELAKITEGKEKRFENFTNFVSQTPNAFKTKFFLTYAINNNFYNLDSVNQEAFWVLFFNLVNFYNGSFILNPVERKNLKQRFNGKKSAQNIIKGLVKKSLVVELQNTDLPSYHTEYKVNTFTDDMNLRLQVANLLKEVQVIQANLYEGSLSWDETKNLSKEMLEKIICDILKHKISKTTTNSVRWIEGRSCTIEVAFSASHQFLIVKSIQNVSQAVVTVLEVDNDKHSIFEREDGNLQGYGLYNVLQDPDILGKYK
jgi:hypothetical protein